MNTTRLALAGGLAAAAVAGTLGHVFLERRYDAVEQWESGVRTRELQQRVDLARNASDGIGVAAFWGIAVGCIGAAMVHGAPRASTALQGGMLIGLGAAPILAGISTHKPASGIWDGSYSFTRPG